MPYSFNRIKSVTEVLLFLYRLLNSMAEVALSGSSTMRLILFRHRNFLETSVERITHEDHLDRTAFEPLKEFHFLKGRFDEAYLQKEALHSNSNPLPSHQRIQEFANLSFTDPKSIEAHCLATLEVGSECEAKMTNAF